MMVAGFTEFYSCVPANLYGWLFGRTIQTGEAEVNFVDYIAKTG